MMIHSKKSNIKIVLCLAAIILLLIPVKVYAGIVYTEPESLHVDEGETKSFRIIADNAAGRVDVSSKNPEIAEVSGTSFWIDQNQVKVKVKGLKAGKTEIIINLYDVTDYDMNTLEGELSVSVSVGELAESEEEDDDPQGRGQFVVMETEEPDAVTSAPEVREETAAEVREKKTGQLTNDSKTESETEAITKSETVYDQDLSNETEGSEDHTWAYIIIIAALAAGILVFVYKRMRH